MERRLLDKVYELGIKKSGSNYEVSIDGVTKEINDYTGEINYAGLFTSRNTTVTFSNVNLEVEETRINNETWKFN